jgi:hypothetical protein
MARGDVKDKDTGAQAPVGGADPAPETLAPLTGVQNAGEPTPVKTGDPAPKKGEGEETIESLKAKLADTQAQLDAIKPVEAPAIILRSTGAASPTEGTKVLIANHHTAAVLLPRSSAVGVNIEPIVLQPGSVTAVDVDEWNERKSISTIRYYLEHGILSETNRMGNAAVIGMEDAINFPIPENLKTEEESRQSSVDGATPLKAAVVRQNVTKVDIGVEK